MGSLKEMISFLTKTSSNLDEIIERLDTIQEFFNNNFSNLRETRKMEIEFLQEAFFSNPESFPEEVVSLYKKEVPRQKKLFEDNLEKLLLKKKSLSSQVHTANKERLNLFDSIKKTNTYLDNREEKLKERITALEEKIAAYNATIDEMNSGFGFLSNFVRMRKIQKQKNKLLDERNELIEDIEDVRARWVTKSDSYSEKETAAQEKWNNAQVEHSIISEKLNTLDEKRDELIQKGAFMAVLESLKGDEPFLVKSVKASPPATCPRCKSDNKENKFFCYYCGERFSKDRTDVEGSLIEIGELNRVFTAIESGIEKSVSFMALMKGVNKGAKEFIKSVDSVKESQDTYSALPNLKIDVPEFSMEFSAKIDTLKKKMDVSFYNLHPMEFSNSVESFEKDVFTEGNIEKFFNMMGNELDNTTKEQW